MKPQLTQLEKHSVIRLLQSNYWLAFITHIDVMGMSRRIIVSSITFNDTSIVFTDDKNKATSLELFEQMTDNDAVRSIDKELSAQGSASKGAVSLMTNILNSPALDGYKGVTPWNERITPEFKQAMRRAEDEYIKPIFMAQHGNPSPHAGVLESVLTPEQKVERKKFAKVSDMLDKYLTDLRAGGSYAVARGFVLEYFAKAGQRPIAENGKLLSVAALKKVLELKRKEHAPATEDTGIAGKLMALEIEIKDRTEKTNLGAYATAIAALKNMLAVYELLDTQNREALTQVATGPTVTQVANDALKQAQGAPAMQETLTGEALTRALREAEDALV